MVATPKGEVQRNNFSSLSINNPRVEIDTVLLNKKNSESEGY